jgi:apolipoprotein N-acyltransferase
MKPLFIRYERRTGWNYKLMFWPIDPRGWAVLMGGLLFFGALSMWIVNWLGFAGWTLFVVSIPLLVAGMALLFFLMFKLSVAAEEYEKDNKSNA